MARMFETLKEVSRSVGYDAWHQFAVVNPLRYLGLIEEAKGSEEPFEVKTGRLEKFGELLKGKIGNIDISKTVSLKKKTEELITDINELIKEFSKTQITSSKDIKQQDKLIILNK